MKSYFNPLRHLTYGRKGEYKRSLPIALRCYWDWDIKPLFTGELYKPDAQGNYSRYTNRFYYWKRLYRSLW